MKLCFYVDEVTPHLLPLAEAMVERLGSDEVRYVYTKYLHKERTVMGWRNEHREWMFFKQDNPIEAEKWIIGCDVLFCRLRDIEVWEKREQCHRLTLYMSERWFRPRHLGTIFGRDIMLPGIVCIFKPGFLSMMYKAAKLMIKSESIRYLPAGIFAAQDMARMCGFFSGDWKCLLFAPRLAFEPIPFGRVTVSDYGDKAYYCLDKMRMWAYFVAPSQFGPKSPNEIAARCGVLKIIWIGRIVSLKRLDVIIRAVKEQEKVWQSDHGEVRFTLDIFGDGPCKKSLERKSKGYDGIKFYPPVSNERVRLEIRAHDVLVLSSNGEEGWGAVINEALEENIEAVGSYEAGASATMLDKEFLFHSGDWRNLHKLLLRLSKNSPKQITFNWTAKNAADALMKAVQNDN